MPPSPALGCSPGRGPKASNHKRGHSFEGGLLFREKDDDLALFNEMQNRERENFLLQSSDDLDDSFSTKLRHFSDFKLGISIPVRGESSDLLNADGEKNDYDWLLTPPDTPLFPSLDDEEPSVSTARRGRPRSQPISISRSSTMEKSYRSSRGSASPNRLSPSPRSGNSMLQSRGRPSSARNSSPTPSLRHATPSPRPSTPPSKPSTPAPRSSTPTPRRMSVESSTSAASPGIRGTSPVKTSRGNSASPKIRAWQTNIPGFSSDAPPNLRTSLADRPATYVRGSSPASRNGRDSSSKFRRQSISPTASRSVSSSHSHDRDRFSTHSKGSIASSGDDDVDSLQSMPVGSLDRSTTKRVAASFSNNRSPAIAKKSTRVMSPSSAPKRSFDLALRQMDQRKSPQNMFRPLLSSVPSTTFYAGKGSSAHRSLISRNSSVTTSSNASSDQGTSAAHDTEGSDHNQDDMASECEKLPYSDIHEEVFAFDKIDVMNEATGHEIHDETLNIHHGNFDRDPKIECSPADGGDSFLHGIDVEVSPTSEASHVRDEFPEVDSLEDMAVCSRCGCKYHHSNSEERDIKLCPACNRKEKILCVTALETATVADTLPVLSMSISEEKPLDDLKYVKAVPELPQDIDGGEPKSSPDEENVEEQKTSESEQNHIHLQENSIARSMVEGGDDRHASHSEMGQLALGHCLPETDSGDQKLHHFNGYPNSKVDISEGAGISLLLRRTSSIKGPVVQGRSFTATSIPYDDLSYARDSAKSMRSSIGHGSFSASSSVDFSSARSTESRVQRQSSGRKLDMENHRYDMNTRSQSTGSSFSGISNLASHAMGLSTSTHEDNFKVSVGKMESDVAQETPITPQEHLLALECREADATSTSFTRKADVEEDDYEHGDSSRTGDASTAEPSHAIGSQLDDYSVSSVQNYEDSASHENSLDLPDCASRIAEVEASIRSPESSFKEEHNILNVRVDGVDNEEVATHSSLITVSEIEIKHYPQSNPCSPSDNVSLTSKSSMDEFLERSVCTLSDRDMIASVPEFNTTDHSHGILEQESTVVVDCQSGSKTKSLTLEEATDTILFCSSIVHDLAFQAATIAMEKENSAPLEDSRPTVTILGKSNNSEKKDLRSRTAGKRSTKSQKARQWQVEMDAKSISGKTENDENATTEPLKRMVEPPNKVDTMKPPKLESKCNCTIM
nr:uncharacterized protein LOC107428366 [Ziziphus jujuba var. spinosa]